MFGGEQLARLECARVHGQAGEEGTQVRFHECLVLVEAGQQASTVVVVVGVAAAAPTCYAATAAQDQVDELDQAQQRVSHSVRLFHELLVG